jgi:glycosyltransferase involved in cell wall biosynthesis
MKRPSVEIVIPAYNEQEILEDSILKLHSFLKKNCKIPWTITIFSNGSTDKTVEIGQRLSKRFNHVNFRHIAEKGKAKTFRHAWPSSSAQIVGFMDADLSTELDAFPKCVEKIIKNGADIVVGNRFDKNSFVQRSFFRSFLSKSYNFLIKLFFPGNKIKDAHCGFKFLRKEVADVLLPHIRNDMWFFDTEFLMYVQQVGYKIEQVSVKWTERKASKVRIARVITEYVLNLIKLRFRLWKLRYSVSIRSDAVHAF